MRIALISYEYPPDTADGGIATYVGQAAAMLAGRGHSVEVFAGSRERTETRRESGVLVHRLLSAHDGEFSCDAGRLFAECHAAAAFDVLESPEWRADGAEAIRLVPDIPLVVKLHTPTYLLMQLGLPPVTPWKKFKSIDRPILYRRINKHLPWLTDLDRYVRSHSQRERDLAHQADEVATPSVSLGQILVKKWHLDPARVVHVPNLYAASEQMLAIPTDAVTNRITFLGRLEVRKGVLDLARAIPLVLRRHPQAKFRFVGRPLASPLPGLDMQQYLERKLARHLASVEFHGPVSLPDIPRMLAETDICVFPSLWENFPNVCLEAMAAGRGVVGSSAGGMLDMLEDGKYGLNVPPHRVFALSEAIGSLLTDPARRMALGQAAREKVLSVYTLERIGALQEDSYRRAIEHRRRLGPRT
jgi:glycosyltransferase involved in cell wall biosynthesis